MKRNTLLLIILTLFGLSCEDWDYPAVPFVKLSVTECSDIGADQAKITGDAYNTGAIFLSQHGFCYGTNNNPTIEDDTIGLGILEMDGPFVANIAGLEHSSVYYVRPYAITGDGSIIYGEAKLLATRNIQLATDRFVRTNFTSETATVVGIINGLEGENENDETLTASKHGHCWSITTMEPNLNCPDCERYPLDERSVDGIFRSELSGLLTDNTVYYVRSYAIIGEDTIYGNVVNFVMESSWQQKQDTPLEGRGFMVGFEIAGMGYVGTGVTRTLVGNNIYYNDFWQYDPIEDALDRKLDVPGDKRAFAVGFSIGNTGYVGLGYGESLTFLSDMWAYNAETQDWEPKDPFPDGGRQGAFCFVIEDKAYIGAGEKIVGMAGVFMNDLWEFDPDTVSGEQWRRVDVGFPGTPRLYANAFTIDGKGYVGAGLALFIDNFPMIDFTAEEDMWQYDAGEESWVKKADLPFEKRAFSIGFAINGKGYIGFGVNPSFQPYKDIWEYNPVSNEYFQLGDLEVEVGRAFALGFTIGNSGYVGFGMNGNLNWLSDFWQFDPN